jgi:hypothetical protein
MNVVTQIPDVASWAQATATELRAAVDHIAAAPVPEHLGEAKIRFATLSQDAGPAIDMLTTDGRIDRDRCLYVISLDREADPEALKAAFTKAKHRSDLKLPQNNYDLSSTLYVGSSCATHRRTGTLRSRLRQHLIAAPRGTYALSLATWTSELPGGITVSAWQYPTAGQGEEGDRAARRIVLAVEDWLAGELKPMLGRRGSRN